MRQAMLALGTGADAYGLIHADLHMDNVLFCYGEARAIDFDDCGFGYWIYDFVSALCDWQDAEAWPRYREALLDGYVRVCPLPEAQLPYLDLFMAGGQVSLMLWATDLAQVNARFRRELNRWREWGAGRVKAFLDSQ
jgi:Ser/Thr protein kinase RdoA (MazF antagonist)